MLTLPVAALLSLLAADAAFDFSPLANVGGIGLVLAWFLWKGEPRLRGIESAQDRMSMVVTVLLMEIENTSPGAKRILTEVKAKIEAAQRERGENKP